MHPQRSCGVGMPAGTGSCSWEMDFMVKKHPLVRVQGWGWSGTVPSLPHHQVFHERQTLERLKLKLLKRCFNKALFEGKSVCLKTKPKQKTLHKCCLMVYYSICEHSQTLRSGTAPEGSCPYYIMMSSCYLAAAYE